MRLSAATITLLRDLLYTLQTECQDCNAGADKMKGRSKSLLLPYQAATGCWNDCSCMLKADPHTAKTYFHAPCEVLKLEDGIKMNFDEKVPAKVSFHNTAE